MPRAQGPWALRLAACALVGGALLGGAYGTTATPGHTWGAPSASLSPVEQDTDGGDGASTPRQLAAVSLLGTNTILAVRLNFVTNAGALVAPSCNTSCVDVRGMTVGDWEQWVSGPGACRARGGCAPPLFLILHANTGKACRTGTCGSSSSDSESPVPRAPLPWRTCYPRRWRSLRPHVACTYPRGWGVGWSRAS
jgi:hypothetical protein